MQVRDNPDPKNDAAAGRTDAELVAACRAGDEAAWEALVQRFQRLVYAIPRRSGLDEDQVADVFQRTFVKLVDNLARINQPDRLSAWLVTTAKRETWRLARLARATIPLPGVGEDDDEQIELPDEQPLPGEVLLELEQQHMVRTALASIDDRCRQLLKLLYFTQPAPAYEAVAATLGMREGSIGPTRARCLDKLRTALAKQGLEQG